MDLIALALAKNFTRKHSIYVRSEHVFADDAERDAYFTANPGEIWEGIYVQSNSIFQRRIDEAWIAITAVLQGPPGAEGPEGPQGDPGPPGEMGDGWGSDVRSPSALDTDVRFWLNSSTGDIYYREGETWTQYGNLIGPEGPQGQGLTIDEYGTLAERDAFDGEAEGFVFVDTDAGNMYVMTSLGWSDPIPFRGPQGETGAGIPEGGKEGQLIARSTADGTVWVEQGKQYHGVESVTNLRLEDSTILADTLTFWHHGNKVILDEGVTCDLNDAGLQDVSTDTPLVEGQLYYVYFKDNTSTLYWSTAVVDLYEHVLVAMVHWNGTIGAPSFEAHNHTRNIDWHINAHLTIGARYDSGFNLVQPVIGGSGSGINIGAGVVFDEDIRRDVPIQTNCRVFYRTSDGTKYTFMNTHLPYAHDVGGIVQYLNTISNQFEPVGNNNFTCSWVYASTDIERPIYLIPTHANSAHNNISGARNETPPHLTGFGLTPEMRLLHKLIFKGDGVLQESEDYRTVSSLPSGFIASTNAGNVSFNNDGTNLTSENVQGALVELDENSLTHFEDSFGEDTAALTVQGEGSDIGMALTTKGTGAITAQIPTSSSAGGNVRGEHAVDFQKTRNSADLVAEGDYSVVLGGRDNKAGGAYSTAGGYGAVTILHGQQAYSAGRFSASQMAQHSTVQARAITEDNTPTAMTLNGSLPISMPGSRFWRFRIDIVAKDANDLLYSVTKIGASKWPMGGDPTLVGAVQTEHEIGDEGTDAWSVDVEIDPFTFLFNIIVTGGAETTRWVAKMDIVEVS